jgi:multidrug efflux pump subunit AcrA (membrane-fusion protein)
MSNLKSRRWTSIGAGLAAFIAVLGGVAVYAAGDEGEGGGGPRPLIITAEVEMRTLIDDVTLRGTVGRVESRQVSSVDGGRISTVQTEDGALVEAGQSILSIDGRDAVAVPGTFPFYRPLEVGSEGNDVLQLETILLGAGYSPGTVDTSFTETTLSALAQWQAAHGYPNTAPEKDETFTISLSPGSGYSVGDESAGAVVIAQGVEPAAAEGETTVAAAGAASPAKQDITITFPVISVESLDGEVAEGGTARFRITSSQPDHDEWKIDLVIGGTAASDDFVAPAGKVTLPRNQQTIDVAIPIRQDDLVEPDENLTVTAVDQTGFNVGSAGSVWILSDDVPELRLSGGGDVAEGVTSIVTIIADQTPIHDTQVSLSVGGDATSGDDFRTIDPVIVLPAGQTRVEVPIVTLVDETLEDPEQVILSLTAGSTQYRVGRTATAVTTIDSVSGPEGLPVITLRPTSTHVGEGQPIPVNLSLSRAVADDIIISLVYGGDAGLGSDYTPVAGRVTVPQGQTSLALSVPTVQDDVVEADRTLTITLGTSALYRIGTPDSGTVTIESDDVPEIRVEGGVSGVAEGGGAGFTLVADQAPVEDISISYQVMGSATPGEDFNALTGIVILPAGQTSIVVPLTTLRDDVMFEPDDMIAGEWPIRIGQILVEEGDLVAPGAPLLSLTETDLTVTLRASASDRTKLEPGQTVTVKLSGGSESAEGTISELDETATVEEATGEQYYEGKVDVAELAAADGSAVTIEVVLDRRDDAVTVPIAAVLQDGAGNDIVRIIDLSTGAVTEVPVTTGISEGSYIQVEGDLQDGDVVVVQVDRPAG